MVIRKLKKIKKLTKAKIKKLEKKEIKKQFLVWSKGVKERDENKCIICKRIETPHTHHIFPREIKDLRFDLDNGVTLCALHHKWGLEISAHRNPAAFIIWMEENRLPQFSRIAAKFEMNRSKNVISKNTKSSNISN